MFATKKKGKNNGNRESDLGVYFTMYGFRCAGKNEQLQPISTKMTQYDAIFSKR